jgi:phage shock protein A
MSILKDLFSIGKGKVSEVGDAIVDANLPTILAQSIREGEEAIGKARNAVTDVVGQQSVAASKLADLKGKATTYNANIQKAIDTGHEDLAREVATRLGPLEAEIAAQQSAVDALTTTADKLRGNLKKAEDNLKQIRSQADVARAVQAANAARAATTTATTGANSQIANAAGALKRLNDKNARDEARLNAAESLDAESTGDDLEKRLQDAGISSGGTSSADDILARFKKAE